MGFSDDRPQELALLAERIRHLRSLQQSQKHLAFVSVHLQEHIDRLQTRIDELLLKQRAS